MTNFFPDIPPIQIAIQIVLGIVIIIILYIITLIMLNIDSIVASSDTSVKPKQMTKIIDGFASISYLNNKSYNTVTPTANSFRKIPKSVNTSGGAQFTYQYWIRIEDANDALFTDLVVLHKGDNRKFNVGYYENSPITTSHPENRLLSTNISVPVIACPMIKFGNSYRDLNIMVNTTKNPFVNVNIAVTPADSQRTSGSKNLLSLLALKNWYLFTFVFKDNIAATNNTENGISLTIYINDVQYYTYTPTDIPEFGNNTLKQNEGDLYLFPDLQNGTDFLKIGNINYYNYALDVDDVIKVFEKGAPTHSIVLDNLKNNQPSYLSAYNKIDIYNY